MTWKCIKIPNFAPLVQIFFDPCTNWCKGPCAKKTVLRMFTSKNKYSAGCSWVRMRILRMLLISILMMLMLQHEHHEYAYEQHSQNSHSDSWATGGILILASEHPQHRFFCTRTFAPIGARVEKNLHQWCKIWYFNAFSCHLVRNFLHQLVQDLKNFCTNAKNFAPIPLDWCKKTVYLLYLYHVNAATMSLKHLFLHILHKFICTN